MIRTLVFAAVITCFADVPVQAQHTGWYPDFESARQLALETNQPLLIHFKSPYCGPCLQMERTVFRDGNILRLLGDGIVSVSIDITQRDDLRLRYGADTIPRDVAVMPDGQVRTLNIGKLSSFAYGDLLRRLSEDGASYRSSMQLAAAEEPDNGVSASETVEQQPSGTESEMKSQPPVELVGLEGFCPVRLNQSREWVPGDPTINSTYKGIVYYFSDEAARDRFAEDPVRFAPSNLGCDPVVLLSAQKAVTGSIRYGAFFDNQLYLFSSLENKNAFKESPLKYTRIRQAIRIDQIQGTRFQ
ncbi:MAG: thioredoxin family protein [Planctomycetaceae bacterium]